MNTITALMGVLALVIGGVFGAYEYLDRKEMARAAETLRMIDLWEEAGARQAYQAISRELETRLSDVSADQLSDPARSATQRHAAR